MPVVVDSQPLETESLGLETVGEVLQHLQSDQRMVVHVLIDGEEPNFDLLSEVRKSALSGKTLFIETADPRSMSRELIAELSEQLQRVESEQRESAELLQQGQNAKALEKLASCFKAWSTTEEAVTKITALLRLDLEQIEVEGTTLQSCLQLFTDELRQVRESLQNRDYVSLADILMYEADQTPKRWGAVLKAIDETIDGMR